MADGNIEQELSHIFEEDWVELFRKKQSAVIEEKFEEIVYKPITKFILQSLRARDVNKQYIRYSNASCYVTYFSKLLNERIKGYYHHQKEKKREEISEYGSRLGELLSRGFNLTEILMWNIEQKGAAYVFEFQKREPATDGQPHITTDPIELSPFWKNICSQMIVVHIPYGHNGPILEPPIPLELKQLLDGWKDWKGVDPKQFFNNYLPGMAGFFKWHRFLTVIPIWSGIRVRPLPIGIVIVNTQQKLIGKTIVRCMDIASKYLSPIRLAEEVEIQQESNRRSAVAAIMARNMSHNLGSHVLTYLSSEQQLDKLWVDP